MRVLVCGDRNWSNKARMWEVLDNFHKHIPISCIIEGEARGADKMSALWAILAQVPVERFAADWGTFHAAAGPIRNKQMLSVGRPQEVLAFHNSIESSKGTKDMLRRALKEGRRCVLYTDAEAYINEEIPL